MKFFKKKDPLKKGFFQYRSSDPLNPYRIHLRVEDNGEGVLVINASQILHLNETGTMIAKYLLEDKTDEEIVKLVKKVYRVRKKSVIADVRSLREKIFSMARSEDEAPDQFINIEWKEPFSLKVSAPYRADLAITYRCNNKCPHCYLVNPQGKKELSTSQWKSVIDKLFNIGIPHIVFTGGEATLRDDLIELVSYTEELGLVTGLLTNGRLLSDKELSHNLVVNGLDHVQITIESHKSEIHNKMVGVDGFKETVEGIKRMLDEDIYLLTNTTITKENEPYIEDTIVFLKDLGVQRFAMNGLIYSDPKRHIPLGFKEHELEPILDRVIEAALKYNMKLIWYTPTQYCNLNPLSLDLGPKACTAAKYNIAIEPDGEVLPCQSYFSSLGNILKDSWKSIWNHELAINIRERKWVPEKCVGCPDYDVCGGGCPLYYKSESYMCLDSASNSE